MSFIPRISWRRFKSALPLLIILAFALFLRLFYYLGVVRGDDFAYSLYAYQVSQGTFDPSARLPGINRPGIYLPVAIIYTLFGVSEFTATLFPLLASLTTAVFIYLILKQLADKSTALVGAFLWAIFPLDVFLATNLDPEGLLAMTTTGAVYFFFRSTKPHQAIGYRLVNFSISAAFVYWAMKIKLSSTPIILTLIILALFTYRIKLLAFLSSIPRRLIMAGLFIAILGAALIIIPVNTAARPLPILINNIELTAYDVLPAWLIGRSNPVTRDLIGNGNWASNRRETIVSIPAPRDNLSETSQRFKSFDAFTLLALVGAAHALVNKDKRAYIPLLWLGILLFYMEWGTFPPRFVFPNLFIYSPLLYWVAEDNFLYLTVPLVLVVSIYLTKLIREKSLPSIYVGIASSVGAALLLARWPNNPTMLNLLSASTLCVVLLAAFSPFILRKQSSNPLLIFALPLMAIATLTPSAHYSSAGFYKERVLRENLRLAIQHMENAPDELIFASSLQTRLDFYSSYAYSTHSEDGRSLFTNELDLVEQNGGYQILRGICDQPVVSFSEWPEATFGEPDSAECISLIHHLPHKEAQQQLETALAEFAPSNESHFIELLNASAQAEDADAFFATLSLYVEHFPETAPIRKASLLAAQAVKSAPSEAADFLDVLQIEPSKWLASPLLELLIESENTGRRLVATIQGTTQEVQTASLALNLEPGSIYLLELDALGSAPIDFVRFPQINIPDSFEDHWEHNLSRTQYSIVFLTPPTLDSSEPVTIELFRVYDRGSIEFYSITLTRISAGQE